MTRVRTPLSFKGPWSVPGRHKVSSGAVKCLDNIHVLEYCLHNDLYAQFQVHAIGWALTCIVLLVIFFLCPWSVTSR